MSAPSSTPPASAPPESRATAPVSPWGLFWRRLRRHRTAMAGGVLLVVLYALSLFAGFVAPYRYDYLDKERSFHRPTPLHISGLHLTVQRFNKVSEPATYEAVPGDFKPLHFFVQGAPYHLLGVIPCSVHLFGSGDPQYPVYLLGADQFGRDILSRVLYGSQISLSIGLFGIALSFTLGMLIGGISGYTGGGVDNFIMRLCELIMSIPGLYLIIALRSVFPVTLSSTQIYLLIIVILSFIRWAGSARVIRGMALSLRERQYVLAARALGQRPLRIIVRHILPGTFSYVIVAATLSIPYYILGEVVLSYLNVGIQEPEASWGLMLNAAQNYQYLEDYPWLLAPGAAIFLTVLAFNFLGDGLRDAADAKAG